MEWEATTVVLVLANKIHRLGNWYLPVEHADRWGLQSAVHSVVGSRCLSKPHSLSVDVVEEHVEVAEPVAEQLHESW